MCSDAAYLEGVTVGDGIAQSLALTDVDGHADTCQATGALRWVFRSAWRNVRAWSGKPRLPGVGMSD